MSTGIEEKVGLATTVDWTSTRHKGRPDQCDPRAGSETSRLDMRVMITGINTDGNTPNRLLHKITFEHRCKHVFGYLFRRPRGAEPLTVREIWLWTELVTWLLVFDNIAIAFEERGIGWCSHIAYFRIKIIFQNLFSFRCISVSNE